MKYVRNKNGYYNEYVPMGERYDNGKPKYKRIRAKTIKELKQKVDDFKSTQIFSKDENMTVEAWSEIWFEIYKSTLKVTTQNFYKTLLKSHILPKIGRLKLKDVKRTDCQSLLNDMGKKELSIKTVREVKNTLLSLFEYAVDDDYLIKNPARRLKATGVPQETRRALTKKERKQYLAAIDDSQSGLYAALLYWFGLRRGECLALTGADVYADCIIVDKQCLYPDNNKAKIDYSTKSKAGKRRIPIPDEARKYIDFKNLPNGYLLHNAAGQPLSYYEQDALWKKFIQKAFADGTEITKHYLRHNYATMLAEKEVAPQVAKVVCGHSSIQTTMEIYQHASEVLSAQARNQILTIGQGIGG